MLARKHMWRAHVARGVWALVALAVLVGCAAPSVQVFPPTTPPPGTGVYALALTPADGAVTISSTLYAFDAATGMLLWRVQPTGTVAAPAANQMTVYVGVNDSDASGTIFADDAQTGAIRWQTPVAQVTQVTAFPAGVLVGEAMPARKGPPTYTIIALDGAHGTFVWSYATAQVHLGLAPVVTPNAIIIATNPPPTGNDPFPPTTVTALNPSTGTVLWHRRVPALVVGMAGNGALVALTGAISPSQPDSNPTGLVMALRPIDGHPLWQMPLAAIPTPPTVDATTVYLGMNAGATDTVMALNAATGTPRWSATTGTLATSTGQPSFAVQDATLFASTTAPAATAVVALRSSDGSLLWQRPEDLALTPPVALGHTVYVGLGSALQTSQKGRLEALDAQTGLIRWRFTAPGSIQFSPTLGE
jgi:outer membrane protein assembly factor BamB